MPEVVQLLDQRRAVSAARRALYRAHEPPFCPVARRAALASLRRLFRSVCALRAPAERAASANSPDANAVVVA